MGASFIYPIFNRAKFLDRTLSGLVQFEMNWAENEILVVDDCSTDNLFEVLQKYEDILPIRVIPFDSSLHPKVGGRKQPITPVWAMNEAVRQARYEQIIPSCPEISPLSVNRKDSLQYFINFPLKSKQCIFAFIFDQAKDGSLSKLVHPTGYWPYFFFGKMWKQDWLDIGGYDEEYMAFVSHGDAELDVRMSRNGFTYLFLAEPVMVHCYHGRSEFSEKQEWFKEAENYFKQDCMRRKLKANVG